MTTITFFDSREELRELTGLPGDNYDKALWDAGFNLDDWAFGFVSDVQCDSKESPYYMFWLQIELEDYCASLEITEYNGRWYYIAHHS